MDSPNRTGIGLPTCVALTTATMVGTGVYTTLGFQLQDLRGGFPILCLWALGGIVSLCGALSYAELAARIPRSGGEYTYLSEIYHPALGFMAGCVSLIAGFAAPIALAAMAFGSYLHAALPACHPATSSVLAVLLISLGHLGSLRASALLQNGMTSLKFLILAVFLLLGFRNALRHPASLEPLLPAPGCLGELLRPASGIALLFVLYAYSGWNASTYLASEVRNGRRNVGLSLLLGTAAVTLLYIALNAVFLTAAPAAELRGVLDVGSVAANRLLGANGGAVMSGVIALGLLASLSAMIWAGPRVTQRIGEDHPPFRALGRTTRGGIPLQATLLQLLLVLVLVATGSFEAILVCAQIPLLLCLILGVAGTLVLRSRDNRSMGSGTPPPFTCPLFPLPPLLFILCSACSVAYSALSRPREALAGLATLALPLLLYPWIRDRTHQRP